MKLQYFLGANSPEGFFSRYTALFSDSRIDNVWILKGGAGCGKSTLMRTVGKTVSDYGFETEEILCSSDPGSLDGLIIPSARLALVDGTAPHVVEPPLCGCGAVYLNLGRFYDQSALLPKREQLFALKEQNAQCYTTAYHCLRAAGEAAPVLTQLSAADRQELREAERSLLPPEEKPAQRPGELREFFLSAFTPEGALTCFGTVKSLCSRLTVLQDSYGLGSPMLSALLRRYIRMGRTVLAGYDPLSPRQLACVLVPQEKLGWVLSSPHFPFEAESYCLLNLDRLAQRDAMPSERVRELLEAQKVLIHQSLACIAQAKTLHDRMEQLYAPAVDFDGVSALTGQLRDKVLSALGL